MANRSLLPVYQALFGGKFDYYDFDNRMQMQKAVYLLQDLGVPVGDYGFRWYRHGPYCQELLDDMYDERHRDPEDVKDISGYQAELDCLKKVIDSADRGNYTVGEWMECLGSMRYLQKRVLKSHAGKDEVLDKLTEKKPHLKDRVANAAAYDCLERMFAL